ncbi:MAG: HEAT repeat domain-containing protein [Tepidisphaerales bacterium]
MQTHRAILLLLCPVLLLAAGPSLAYVDYTPTLGRIVLESHQIVLAEVEKIGQDKPAIIFRKVADLKGATADEPIRLHVGAAAGPVRAVLDWAEPGKRAVIFRTRDAVLVCLGHDWFQAHSAADGWWRLTTDRSDLPLAYCGSIARLEAALRGMVAGRTVVITTLSHGAGGVGACCDVAFNRTNLPGLRQFQRIRANQQMPSQVCYVSNEPGYFLSLGTADAKDVPRLIEQLKSTDSQARIDAADDLRTLGPKAAQAAANLELLLKDVHPAVRAHATAALCAVSPQTKAGVEVLAKMLTGEAPAQRRLGAQCAGLAGPAARGLVPQLAALLGDADTSLRAAALEAIATLGPEAADARDAVVKLLDDPKFVCDAADALGRMGPAARPALKAIAPFLQAQDPAVRWAAVRAMVQIGGPEASPAVDFLLVEIENARGRDLYNISIYLGILGPVAERAMPALQQARQRDRELCAMALWAIQPEKKFPWQWGYVVDRDMDRWLYESYIREMGPRARPAAKALAAAVIAGTAGYMPSWGYQLLIDYPDDSLAALQEALKRDDPAVRQRVLTALGSMGPAAIPARAAIEALATTTDPRSQRLVTWALRRIDGK